MRIFLLFLIIQAGMALPGHCQTMYRILGGVNRDQDAIELLRYDLRKENPDTISITPPAPDADRGYYFDYINFLSNVFFHPNGKLLLIGYNTPVIEINLKTRTANWMNDTPVIFFEMTDTDPDIYQLFLTGFSDEDGEIIISSEKKLQSYNILTGETKTLKEGNLDYYFSFFKEKNMLRRNGNREIFIHDPETDEESPFFSISDDRYVIYGCTRSYDEDHNPYLIINVRDMKLHGEKSHDVDLDLTSMTQSVIERPDVFGSYHSPTTYDGFRRNGYMVSLDADRSSGHYTGGYYDTAYVCHPVASIADEDIRFELGGQRIDSILFQLLGSKPSVVSEEDLEYSRPDIRQVDSKRWRWVNPGSGAGYADAEEVLHDIMYTARWEEGEAAERIVGVTTYLQGDSTVSWSVIQLTDIGNVAGPDLNLTACDTGEPVDLKKSMSSGASIRGRLVPELASGTLVFDPQKDPSGEYMYIVEGRECADTARWVLTREEIDPLSMGDTLVCRGAEIKIQTTPVLYDSIRWSDGSQEAVFTTTTTGSHWLKAWKGNCKVTDTFRIEEHPQDNVIYDLLPDTLSVCDGERIEWDLTEYDPDGIWVDGREAAEQIIRDPLTPGRYAITLEKGECRHEGDLEIVIAGLHEGMESMPADTAFCPREEAMIDLRDYFSGAVWADGFPHAGRLFRAPGAYIYSASRDGCMITDTLHVEMKDQCNECEVTFPNAFSPNGDGQNDSFEVFTRDCHTVEGIRIYDRWGNLMLDTREDIIPSFRFESFAEGVYLVVVEVSDSLGEKVRKQAVLHLLR